MLFNSVQYLIYFLIVYVLYWFVTQKKLKQQNALILISSYFFYGCWDWRFLFLIALSTIIDFFVGLKIYNSSNNRVRKILLWTSILFNLSLLGFFKYYNFFIDSWIALLNAFGYKIQDQWTLNIILPVGISFYTFQTMSYSLDIYYRRYKPTRDLLSFASFVSFFPQLVAGPIERACNLLPQILNKREFNYDQTTQGLRLILWGLFKKIVIADTLSGYVDKTFSNYTFLNGGDLLFGLIYFAFQIYCDFSGYSDIAIGTAKLFGIELMSNFKFPYFSRNIGEFWRRWHISLSSWFRDYLYIPLGGSRKGLSTSLRNIFIIFIVSGIWHGANWTFIIWGIIHASIFIPLFIQGKNRKYSDEICCYNKPFPTIKELFQIAITFFLTSTAWVFFRSQSIDEAFLYLYFIVAKISLPAVNTTQTILIIPFIFLDWLWRKNERDPLNLKNSYLRWGLYYIILLSILIKVLRYRGIQQQFIYFQF